MYSTQAILPELGRAFSVTPSQTGLTVSITIGALAVGSWFWGPLSDRIGRRASLVLASAAMVVPTLLLALAPDVLGAARAAGAPGAVHARPAGRGRAVRGGGLRAAARAARDGLLRLLAGGRRAGRPRRRRAGHRRDGLADRARRGHAAAAGGDDPDAAAAAAPRTSSPPARARCRCGARSRSRATRRCSAPTVAGSGLFFAFMGVFSYVDFRLEGPPFDLSPELIGLVFVLWIMGVIGPLSGRLAGRVGWQRVALGALRAGGRRRRALARGRAAGGDRRARAGDARELRGRDRGAARGGASRRAPTAAWRARSTSARTTCAARSAAGCRGSRGRARGWTGVVLAVLCAYAVALVALVPLSRR